MIQFLMKFTVWIAKTQNLPERFASCHTVRAPSYRVLLCLSAIPLCSGVYGGVVSWIIPSHLHMSWNSFPIYSPPLSVCTLFTLVFFCLDIMDMYHLNESDTVVHSLSLRKSMLAYLDFTSIQVTKYLYPLIECSNGPQMLDTITLLIFVVLCSVPLNSARVCFPKGQCWHCNVGSNFICVLRPIAVFERAIFSSVE